MNWLAVFNLTPWQWALGILSAFFIGAAKTGVAGITALTVPVMALIFGGKLSAGLVLPMLSFADIFAVIYYRRHAEWFHIRRLLPWALAGVGIGLLVGHHISDKVFKIIMGCLSLGSIGLILRQEIRKKNIAVPAYWWFAALLGLLGGFSTMIGNAAGPVMTVYLLAMRLPKDRFIGTAAWFFFIINLIKIPLHIFIWKTITLSSFLFDVTMLPALALGALLGIRIVKRIPERSYRVFIIIMTTVSALLLLFKA